MIAICKGADVLRSVSLVFSRLIEVGLVVLGLAILFWNSVLPWILWELLAAVYLAIRIVRVVRSKRHGGDQAQWLGMLLGRRSGLLLTLFTSLVGMSGGLMVTFNDDLLLKIYTPDEIQIVQALAVPTVLMAWGILHFGYAERYAQAYYAALPNQLLIFPGTPRPIFLDFAYFSFTVGTSFAVSDVETTGSEARGRLLAHSVLSFFYNTATLAVAIGVLTQG
jgi:uncharacterized membrane protein